MARNATNPLAVALDKRIRAMVDETVADAVRREVREVLREELSGLFGTAAAPAAAAPAPTAAAPAKRPVGRPKKSATTPTATRTTSVTRTRSTAAPEGASPESTKCGVVGCKRPYRSRGYCAAHYQAARKYGWPMPAPAAFDAPPRPSRGRPPKRG